MNRKLYGLEIRYNNNKPLYCFSAEHAGVGAQLYNVDDSLNLMVYVKVAGERTQYQLKTILPGDKLNFRYLDCNDTKASNIDELEALSRGGKPSALHPGFKIGLDAKLKSGKTVRVSHLEDGFFGSFLATYPLIMLGCSLWRGTE